MPIDDESWHNLEMVWSRIELGDRKLYVGVLYLPPDRSRDVTLAESFSSCISKISSFCAPEDDIIFLGDFNMPGIKWCSSQASFLYPDPERSTFSASSNIILDSLSTATLRQINSVVNENGRMLDLCFANDGFRLPTIESAPAPLVKVGPHHPALLVTINISRLCNPADKLTPFYLDYKNADFDIISRVLATIDWESELELANPNAAAETFSHILNYVIDRHVPKRTANANPRTPWATAALRQLKATKRRALRNFNKHKSPHTKEEYRKLNSAYKKACQRSYQNHLRRIQQNLKTSPKSFWNHVKNQRNEPGTPSCMFLDGIMANSDSGICDLFANKFSSIFDTSSITDDQLNRAIRSVSPLGFSLNGITVEDTIISKAATKLKNSFSTGPDGIPATFLKRFMPSLLTRLIFQASLDQATFPSLWKEAYIKKQTTVAMSSSEAEYVALSAAAAESIWLSGLLEDMKVKDFKMPVTIYEDNRGYIGMAKNLETKRTKNIDVKHHFIRDHVAEGRLQIEAIGTQDQLADLFTKALEATRFQELRSMLGLTD
ncbi:uncharacterized protein LOC129753468 [Uranotaenia lowii]|uniref:uncharacterized protein LOC129753468 n=1 Tax=Uranotaenia lowii TaxID=190385 RepID=UPI0024790650|nr:uncharacterized protein LOC129753468 [Uranotaenia lowii]